MEESNRGAEEGQEGRIRVRIIYYYRARITINYKVIYLGYFKALSGAVEARNNYIIEHELWEYPIQEWMG